MDRLQCMASFIRVVEKGSFARAAEGTGLTAAMIGNHVRYLEDRLGGLLLNRTTRRQSLTELGREFHTRCQDILQDVADAEAVAHTMQGNPRGLLKITAPTALGSGTLPALIGDYLAANPDVEIELMLSDRVINLIDEGFDLAIRVGDLPDSGLIRRTLKPFRLILCASPGYLAKAGVPEATTDLANHQCLDFAASSLQGRWRLEPGDEIQPRGRFRSNNGHALLQAAKAGMGIVLIAELLVEDDIAAGKLVPVLGGIGPAARPMALLYPPDRRPTPKLRSFVNFMTVHLGPDGDA